MKVFDSYGFTTYLQMTSFRRLCLGICLIFVSGNIFAQSNDQNFPTPISTNQINTSIRARDIGDSRLTTYYYIFNGNRGDIFINVVSSNFNGDIDVFTSQGLKPKTKITLFADEPSTETGRVIYMRQAEKLIFRIQGRTPNDDAAIIVIKFAGSFEPIQAIASTDDSNVPEVTASNKDGIIVNSVGTIIRPLSTQTPEKTEVIAEKRIELNDKIAGELGNKDGIEEATKEDVKANKTVSENEIDDADQNKESATVKSDIPLVFDPTEKVDDVLKEADKVEKPRLLIVDSLKNEATEVIEPQDKNENVEVSQRNLTLVINKKPSNKSTIVTIERVDGDDETEIKNTEEKINPLASVFLKVELKNGERFERSMVEVLSMNVIKGVLTIVTNDGKIIEYSILDVVKMTIE